MAFNPNSYKAPAAKPLPVVLLLDVSGSMSGSKIDNLYDAVVEMVKTFEREAIKETIINVAIITFGSSIELHTPYTPVSQLVANGISRFSASGGTPMDVALRMAKDMIEDKETTPSKSYRPAVVLVSDGYPNNDCQAPLDAFINTGRSQKCQRFAIAIGNDADTKMLRRFADNDESMFEVEDAGDIASKFQKITMSVSMRSRSKNPNEIPKANVSYDAHSSSDDDDDDDF